MTYHDLLIDYYLYRAQISRSGPEQERYLKAAEKLRMKEMSRENKPR